MTPEDILKKYQFVGDTHLLIPAMKEYGIQARIQERRDCIYLLESDMMDHPRRHPTYTKCMKDEISNHNAFIQDLEKELLTLTSPTYNK